MAEIEGAPESGPVEVVARPKTRGDCIEGPRPCPWVSCPYHLFLNVSRTGRTLQVNRPDLVDPDGTPRLEEMADTCALDVAARGGEQQDFVAATMGLSRETTRLIEASALAKVEARSAALVDPEERRSWGKRVRQPASRDELPSDEAVTEWTVARGRRA